MKIVCPNCEESYSINTNLFLDKKQNIKCINCKHQWIEIFIDKSSIGSNPFLERSSAIQKVPLTDSEVLKILREEAEFNAQLKKPPRRNKKQNQNENHLLNLNDLDKSKDIRFLDLLSNKEFWVGFCSSVILATILFFIYVYGELLADIFPYFKDHLLKYLNFVDSIRVKIDLTKNDLIFLISQFFNFE